MDLVMRTNNAGLIIVWPFLPRLFEQLGMIDQERFINTSLQHRSVYILQFLVYNQIDYPEYELVLNKLLVGIPIHEHLEPIVGLSPEEEQMAQSLMNGLIHNWEKVKNSTVEGVQETFLKREGVLYQNKDIWKLIITRKGVDVLLESITWDISLIKFPWMHKPLHVEWM